MSRFKATKPRANPPLCWECDKLLYGGGRFYELVTVDGVERPVHGDCKKRMEREAR